MTSGRDFEPLLPSAMTSERPWHCFWCCHVLAWSTRDVDLFPTLPGLANCQAGWQQPGLLREQPYAAWESAGVNDALDLSHAKSSLEFGLLEMF